MGKGILMKIALYTVNVGGYDTPIEPPQKIEGVDMFMFTDTPYESLWSMCPLPVTLETSRKTSRYPKINSHLMFPDYDYTIYVDSNMFITRPPTFFIENFLQDILFSNI